MAFALLIYAGLEGIEKKRTLCKPTNLNLRKADEKTLAAYAKLPDSLEQALVLAKNSDFVNRVLPPAYVEKFAGKKERECRACQKAGNAFRCEKELYFEGV